MEEVAGSIPSRSTNSPNLHRRLGRHLATPSYWYEMVKLSRYTL
jgi:hypothetical protein